MSVVRLLDSVVGLGLVWRNAPVRELDIALCLVNFEHAVDQAHKLLVNHCEDNTLLLDTKLLEPLSCVANYLLVSVLRIRLRLLKVALELLERDVLGGALKEVAHLCRVFGRLLRHELALVVLSVALRTCEVAIDKVLTIGAGHHPSSQRERRHLHAGNLLPH